MKERTSLYIADISLYAAIAGLGSVTAFSNQLGLDPKAQAICGVLLAILTAVKAKLSPAPSTASAYLIPGEPLRRETGL